MSASPPPPERSGSPDAASISAIEVVATNPNLRRIKAGRRTLATLSANDVDALNLHVGQAWTEQLAGEAERCVRRAVVEKAALAMLGRRSYAIAEMRRKLIEKDHAEELVESVVARLTEDGWLDDRRHAEALLQESLRAGGASRAYLTEKLMSRDVPSDIAEDVVEAAMDGPGEVEVAMELAARALRTAPVHATPAARMRRVAGALGRKGFDEDTIRAALEKLGFDVD